MEKKKDFMERKKLCGFSIIFKIRERKNKIREKKNICEN